MEMADCVRPTVLAAWVKLLPSAISTKARSRSGSRLFGWVMEINFSDSGDQCNSFYSFNAAGHFTGPDPKEGDVSNHATALLEISRPRTQVRPWHGIVQRLALMAEVWRTRRILSEMDPRLLKDIGVSYAEAEAEANKPFWVV